MKKKGKEIIPVIKADAYGHGVLDLALDCQKNDIRWIAIGIPEEGMLVRKKGYLGKIISLLSPVLSPDQIDICKKYKVIPLIHSEESLASVLAAQKKEQMTAFEIALKMDTGMGRLGFRFEELENVLTRIKSCPFIIPVILISHLAAADDPEEDAYTAFQERNFLSGEKICSSFFPQMHFALANTAGLLSDHELPGDMARPGISLYGYNPFFGTMREKAGEGFLPVMEVTAPILSIRKMKQGESLGYGRAWRAERDSIAAWVGIGYADGYRRNPKPGACMNVLGKRVPVIGRIAMQMTCIDLTELADLNGSVPVHPGEPVYVLGGKVNPITAQDLADWWGTIPYEVLCLLGKNSKII